MKLGVILYGAPAAGKDTVTAALTGANHQFRLFERLKAGPGRTTGYRMTTPEKLDRLAASSEIIWENSRYDARYAIDRPQLMAVLESGAIPVVHAGQLEVVDAVREATPDTRWIVVELRCSRDTAAARIAARATNDTRQRLAAWDATIPFPAADLRIDTGLCKPAQAAKLVQLAVVAHEATAMPELPSSPND